MTTYMFWVILGMNTNRQQPHISWYEICKSINVHKKKISVKVHLTQEKRQKKKKKD